MKVIFSQIILLRVVNHAYIKSKDIKKHTSNHFPILSSSSFLTFTTKDLLFYSLDLQAFQMNGYLLDSNESILRWKNNQRKLFCFFLLYALQNFLFSLFLSFLSMSSNDYLLKTSHLKKENPNGVIGLL